MTSVLRNVQTNVYSLLVPCFCWCGVRDQSAGSKKKGGDTRPKNAHWLGTVHMPCVNKDGKAVASGWDSAEVFRGHIKGLVEAGKIMFAIGQLEKGEETGALHVQCYVRFKTAQRLSAVVNMMAKTDHWEIAKNPAAAANYCCKPETRHNPQVTFTFGTGDPREAAKKGEKPSRDGTGPGQGARTDIAKAVQRIQSGAKAWEIMDESPHLMVQYPRMFEQAQAALEAKRRDLGIDKASDKVDMRVIVLWGDSGTGKSHRARYWLDYLRQYKGLSWTASAPVLQNGVVWADNYSGEDVVLMEDFNPHPEGSPPVDEELFLRLLDVWARPTANRKGKSAVTMRATWWFFTSNHDPQHWWPTTTAAAAGRFTRRISYVEKMEASTSQHGPEPEDLSPLGEWIRRQCAPPATVDSRTPLTDPSLLLSDGCSPTSPTSQATPVTLTTTSLLDSKHRAPAQAGASASGASSNAATSASTATRRGSSVTAAAAPAEETPTMQYTPRRLPVCVCV